MGNAPGKLFWCPGQDPESRESDFFQNAFNKSDRTHMSDQSSPATMANIGRNSTFSNSISAIPTSRGAAGPGPTRSPARNSRIAAKDGIARKSGPSSGGQRGGKSVSICATGVKGSEDILSESFVIWDAGGGSRRK